MRAVSVVSGDLSFENGWTLTEHYKVGIDQPGIAMLDDENNLVGFMGRDGFWHTRGIRDLSLLSWTRTTAAERAGM